MLRNSGFKFQVSGFKHPSSPPFVNIEYFAVTPPLRIRRPRLPCFRICRFRICFGFRASDFGFRGKGRGSGVEGVRERDKWKGSRGGAEAIIENSCAPCDSLRLNLSAFGPWSLFVVWDFDVGASLLPMSPRSQESRWTHDSTGLAPAATGARQAVTLIERFSDKAQNKARYKAFGDAPAMRESVHEIFSLGSIRCSLRRWFRRAAVGGGIAGVVPSRA